MASGITTSTHPLAGLRRMARASETTIERCELCGRQLGADHDHLVEATTRKLACACAPCAILFDGKGMKYRRVPRQVEILGDFQMSDAEWEGLHLPIQLAFFFFSSPAGRVVAVYPSPAGATESLLPLEAWGELAAANPVLRELASDVEALLVNRVGEVRDYFRVPIDECFRLVGIIRMHWRGLSGGTEVWREIGKFMAALKERSAERGGGHA